MNVLSATECTFKMAKMVNFILYIFYKSKQIHHILPCKALSSFPNFRIQCIPRMSREPEVVLLSTDNATTSIYLIP